MKSGRWVVSMWLAGVLAAGWLLSGAWNAAGQAAPPAAGGAAEMPSDLVTLNVDEGQITQVLNAFSRQTGRSIVLGPEVQGKVTARLSNVQWRDALDAILKPYGYGYYMVGDTIIIGAADKIPKPAAAAEGTNVPAVTSAAMPAPAAAPPPPEPLVVKVFTLKYLDARDVEPVLKSQLSPRGTIGRLVPQSQSWEEAVTGTRQDTSSESLGRLKRFSENPAQVTGKTLVIVDTKDALDKLALAIAEMDRAPIQVQIEAKFVEVSANLLRDIGVEWGTGGNGATAPGVKTIGTTGGGKLYAAGAQQISGTLTPAGFTPQSGVAVSGSRPFNAGLSLAFQKLTDMQFEVLMHLLEEDSSFRMLSAPRVMTMNNQDAVILVGQKLPIVSSTTGAGDTPGTTKTTTELKYYEDIGIKLKVMPQICDDNTVNLIVHPSVRELLGYQTGNAGVDTTLSGAPYPIIAAREAETQVLVKSGQTMVIGGMIREKAQKVQLKVPVLGSIPLLGVLFRRETVNTEKIELLIFLTVRIVKPGEETGVTAPATVAEGLKGSAAAAP